MQELLLCLLFASVGCNTIRQLDRQSGARQAAGEVAVTTRPLIYYCRSPNMEVFSCWWHPLTNLTEGEDVTYVLTYSIEKGPKLECPDYLSAGANSCHFDKIHTIVWNIYCMNVTAVTARQNFTSPEHCLDVVDNVQTYAPVNLTYKLMDTGGDEMGHDVLFTWSYPRPSDLQYGWITLVYELQYRRVSEPDKWKVKQLLREPQVKLLGLPINDYVLRVRSRSQNHGRWSEWSQPLLMSIPARAPADKLLVLILVTSISILVLLAIAVRVIPQCVRMKDFFLPPIPKPRIIGIDPLLLKKGNLDEINRHLTNFHGYLPPSLMDTEVWEQVSPDKIYLSTPKECTIPTESLNQVMDAVTPPHGMTATRPHDQLWSQQPTAYTQSPYCLSPPQAFSQSPWAEIVSVPENSYSIMEQPGTSPPALSTTCPPQDLYSCVKLINDRDGLQLVPCLPPAYCELPELPNFDLQPSVKEEEDVKLAEYQARKKDAARAKES
ncbi:prolactin receptor-like isoform X2 [Syngnathoides biaculeatus]|uniref:prolactin receptor-like isoform X2 n=1 Tax=Syngnathoides biaculeatus TaxID=300417 RepID=UPI002ADD5BCE|nr:prolactin receptor-like isoform X2 [Syngnathoides biaculeatus]